MKILFITDNFYPEQNAPGKRTYEHAIPNRIEYCNSVFENIN